MKEKQQKAFETLDEYLQDISGLTDHQYHWIKIAMEDYAKRYASSLQPSQVDEEGIKAPKKWIETNWSNGNYDDHCMDDVYNAMVEMYKAAASSIPSNGEWISVEKDADYDGEYYGYIKRTEECGAVNEIQRVVVNRYNKWILEANEELLYYMPLFAKPIK